MKKILLLCLCLFSIKGSAAGGDLERLREGMEFYRATLAPSNPGDIIENPDGQRCEVVSAYPLEIHRFSLEQLTNLIESVDALPQLPGVVGLGDSERERVKTFNIDGTSFHAYVFHKLRAEGLGEHFAPQSIVKVAKVLDAIAEEGPEDDLVVEAAGYDSDNDPADRAVR